MKNIRKTSGILLCLLACLGALSACGKEESNEPFTYRAPAAKQEEEKADTEEDTQDFVIEQMDMVGETMTLYAPESERQVRYAYTLGTRFMDKYGDSYSSIHFTPGQVVQLGDITAASALSSVKMSDQVWNQTDVTNYKIDMEKGIFTIGQTQYRITSNTMAFSQDASISLYMIGTDDTLQVIGKDKEVWSVIVTTGHGYIQLQNSSIFVDSMICIGNRIFTKITGDMLLEVPEGTVRRWKNTYKWNSERSDKKANVRKRGGQIGNKNAVGGNQSAPLRNHNAEKFGFFRKYLPEETVSIIEEMPKDPLDVLWDQIQIAYAAIIRAQQIMYVQDRDDKTIERIEEKDGNVCGEKWEVQQAWDKHGNFLQAQARAQKTLESMINKYDDLLHKNWELATEEQRARIERIKADTERIKGGEQASTEDKVAKLFDAIGAELDAE